MNRVVLVFISLLLSGCRSEAKVQDGDIIFHTSRSAQSEAVQRATNSKYSHMGIIIFRSGKPFVFEAVNPVKFTPLQKWIDRGKGGHYVVKRLQNAEAVLTPVGVKKLNDALKEYEGKPYDLTFEWSDDRIYCSELVWKLYKRVFNVDVGRTQQLRDFNLNEPVVKAKMKERYGDNVPLGETVISPEAIFKSSNLLTVKSS